MPIDRSSGPHSQVPLCANAAIDAIGQRGCRYVVQAIARLEQQQAVPELAALTSEEREAALAELKAVMAVYDAPCDSGAKSPAQ